MRDTPSFVPLSFFEKDGLRGEPLPASGLGVTWSCVRTRFSALWPDEKFCSGRFWAAGGIRSAMPDPLREGRRASASPYRRLKMRRRDFALGGFAGTAMAATAQSMTLRSFARLPEAPAVLRRGRSLVGESVDVRDYCAVDGRRDDTQAFQELLDLRPAIIRYPAEAVLTLTRPIELRSNQAHIFAAGARIEASVAGFALSGTGRTTGNLARLGAPVSRYDRLLRLDRTPDVKSGDVIVLADLQNPNAPRLDINVVERLSDAAITTLYPIGRPFSDHQAFRIYHLYDPLTNIRMIGPAICANRDATGGFLRFAYTRGARLRGLTLDDAGYIGFSFESSLEGRFENLAVRGSGASGLGMRAAKRISIDGFSSRQVRSDESLTFYDNVSGVVARRINIEQYLHQERSENRKAGNNILVDLFCSKIDISDVKCAGSATYNVMFHNQSDDCSISNFNLRQSNLGGIRVSANSNRLRIGAGTISDVVDTVDHEGRKAVSAISIGESCSDTSISRDVLFKRIRTNIQVSRFSDSVLRTGSIDDNGSKLGLEMAAPPPLRSGVNQDL